MKIILMTGDGRAEGKKFPYDYFKFLSTKELLKEGPKKFYKYSN